MYKRQLHHSSLHLRRIRQLRFSRLWPCLSSRLMRWNLMGEHRLCRYDSSSWRLDIDERVYDLTSIKTMKRYTLASKKTMHGVLDGSGCRTHAITNYVTLRAERYAMLSTRQRGSGDVRSRMRSQMLKDTSSSPRWEQYAGQECSIIRPRIYFDLDPSTNLGTTRSFDHYRNQSPHHHSLQSAQPDAHLYHLSHYASPTPPTATQPP